ncbi:MAG: acyl-CoA dehydrogenase family protein [Alphaproteobacteria bacterium]|nr:acyl-CoA dehydrogenase family protein [Alphaproteobacteria bacterium]
MSFALTDDQRQLADSIARFLDDKYAFDARRRIMAEDRGWSPAIWAEFAELGWLALPIAEEHGGLGGTTVDLALMMEHFGRSLVVEPFVASVVLGAETIARADEAKATELLPAVAEGKMTLALAHGEPTSRYDLSRVGTTAAPDGKGGWRLSGHKAVVLHGDSADRLIVSARTGGAEADRDGITLFLVDSAIAGVTRRPYPTIDGLRGADVILDDVSVSGDAVLGPVGGAFDVLEPVIDRACVALSAEAVGAMGATVQLTAEYMKTREQFGRPLGSFQVLQHRAVEMLSASEFARALCYRAAGAMDATFGAERSRAASAIKAEIGRAGKMIGEEAVQLHGGMGMTNEMAVGHYFKRLRIIDTSFGNAAHHLRRFATLG